MLIDIHGEYSAALGDIASVFSVIPKDGETKLHIPYWCVSSENLIDFLCGTISEGNKSLIFDRIVEQKIAFIQNNGVPGVDVGRVSADTPIPFNLKQIWHDLMVYDNANWDDKEKTIPSYIDEGDAETLSPPKFKPPGAASNPPHKGNGGVMKKQLDLMRSRLLDNQFSFFMSPGDWQPDADLKVKKDLPELIENWLGHGKPITILDLSGMPSTRLDLLLGSVLDIIFESALWGRNYKEVMKTDRYCWCWKRLIATCPLAQSAWPRAWCRRSRRRGASLASARCWLVKGPPKSMKQSCLSAERCSL